MYFSVEKMVKGYLNVYERVIEEHQYKKQNGHSLNTEN